jgi:N-succinyldiaminopimelate aminotransferase
MSVAGNNVFAAGGTTIFTVMSALSQQHHAINLGQGFPDDEGPDDVRAIAAKALMDGPNQYPPMMGLPDLRHAVAAHDKHFYGLDIDPEAGVLVTSGATEALAACIFALTNAGDEVIVIEPLYDCYVPIIRRAGAVPVFIRLQPPDWSLPVAEIRAAITPRTKAILYNTPHNPTGVVFSAADIAQLANILHDHPHVLAICDEVYEHLLFDEHAHVPLLSFPGMKNRALKIGSAGKTFSLTGWKVGYVSGDPSWISLVSKAHQFLTFTTPPNLQTAVAYGLRKPDTYFMELARGLQAKRNYLHDALHQIGFDCFPAQGSYFLTASYARFSNQPAETFARTLVEKAGVATIPYDPFYANPSGAAAPKLIRFCFAKQMAVLRAAEEKLATFARSH